MIVRKSPSLAEQILAGGVKDRDKVRVSVRDRELTMNGWPIKVARATRREASRPSRAGLVVLSRQ